VQLMRVVFPHARRIGIVWNPAEACSEACLGRARTAATKYNFELLEATVSSTSEVLDAVRSLFHRSIDIFFTSGDNTVGLAVSTIAQVMRERHIPYVTNDPSDVPRGAFLSLGADYTEVGRATARLALRVFSGERPRDIPIQAFVPEKLAVNVELAKAWGIALPPEVAEPAVAKSRPSEVRP
jgi:ABC-type uncharacterized transport system substrate-binding protein